MRNASIALLCFAFAACQEKTNSKVDPTQPPAFAPVDLAGLSAVMPAVVPKEPPPPAVKTSCPPEMAPIPLGGCIDRYEASAGKGELGSKDGKGTTVVAESKAGVQPLANVTLAQAEKACANARKHVCTDPEWLSSCKGITQWRETPGEMHFPYGSQFEKGRCNDWEASEHGKKGATLTGSFSRCVTPGEAVYDLSGNLAEISPEIDDEHHLHLARGGSFHNVMGDASCENDEYPVKGDSGQPDYGFRCCSAGKPLP